MRRMTALLAIGVLTAGVGGAGADVPSRTGLGCSYAGVADPLGPPGLQTGVLTAGPLTVADLPWVDEHQIPPVTWDVQGNPAFVEVICAIQINDWIYRGTSNDVIRRTTGEQQVAAVLAPTDVAYFAEPGETVFLCTTVVVRDAHDAPVTLYLEHPYDFDPLTEEGTRWSSDPNTAECAQLTHQGVPDGGGPPLLSWHASKASLPEQVAPNECGDGVDNDGDGRADHLDWECRDEFDDDESF